VETKGIKSGFKFLWRSQFTAVALSCLLSSLPSGCSKPDASSIPSLLSAIFGYFSHPQDTEISPNLPILMMPCPGVDHALISSQCGRYYPAPDEPATYISFAVLSPRENSSYQRTEAAVPVIYFSGGPGEGGNTSQAKLDFWRYWLLDAGIQRPFVVWDSRGNKGAWGNFNCESYRRWSLERLKYPDLDPGTEAAKVAVCLQQWQTLLAGSGLQQFNSRQNALDILALLRALGFDQWHLMSSSYGSRVAEWLSDLASLETVSMLLDSPYSWELNSRAAHARQWRDGLTKIFRYCQQDPTCHQGENIESRFWQVIQKLDKTPITIQFHLEGYRHSALMGANDFAHLLFSVFYHPEKMLWTLPESGKPSEQSEQVIDLVDLLSDVYNGDLVSFSSLAAPILAASYGQGANSWIYWASECNDNKILTPGEYDNELIALGKWARFLPVDLSLQVCHLADFIRLSLAPSGSSASAQRPNIALVGELDPVTSMDQVKRTQIGKQHALIILAQNYGHGVFAGGVCGDQWYEAYWSDPVLFIDSARASFSYSQLARPLQGRANSVQSGNQPDGQALATVVIDNRCQLFDARL
jgi:pimeloyl-ACP methyl ester carboxylesterase